jgi:hypothetical protein
MTGAVRGSLVALVAIVAIGASACVTPTQLLVRIDSDLTTDVSPRVPGDGVLRAVRVEVCEGSCDRAGSARDQRFWAVSRESGGVRVPFSFGVAPRDPAEPGQVELRVDALEVADETTTEVLFTTRRTVPFVAGQRIEVPIFLSRGCVGRSCPPGLTCGDDGQCMRPSGPDAGLDVATLDAGLLDAGLLDAGLADAGLAEAGAVDAWSLDAAEPDAPRLEDASPIDAPMRDAPTSDAQTSDAGLDASAADAGPCAWTDEPFPSAWTAVSSTGINGGWVRGLARGDGDAILTTGTSQNTTFTWLSSTSTSAHFVSRESSAGTWVTFATFDRARFSGYGQLSQVAEHAGVVYVAGTTIEALGIAAAGGSVTVPEMPAAADTALRAGVVVVALDASSGRPRWAQTIKTLEARDFLDAIVADEAGIWIAFRSFPATGAEIGALTVGGEARAVDVGPAEGHARIARLAPDGSVTSVRAFGGIAANGLDIASLGAGELLVAIEHSLLTGHTEVSGLTPTPPPGEMVLARLGVSGDSLWSASLECAAGTWRARAGRLAVVDDRVFFGLRATTLAGEAACTSLRIRDATGERSASLPGTTADWMAVTSFDVCDGAWTGDSFTMAVAAPASFSAIAADRRAVVITGHVGVGGVSADGRTISGREIATGDGSDAFAFVLSPSLSLRFSRMLGGTRDSILTGGDDYGTSVLVAGPDRMFLSVGLTDVEVLDGVTIPGGARRIQFHLR